jgi:hypothetical protein
MRFEVPQFIEVEDKIIGPFTWKQFIYLAGGIGALLILYFTTPFMIFVLLGLPLGILSGFLAFHQINNRPFSIFLESFISYMSRTKTYLWKRGGSHVVTHFDEDRPHHMTYIERHNIHALAKQLEINTLEHHEK